MFSNKVKEMSDFGFNVMNVFGVESQYTNKQGKLITNQPKCPSKGSYGFKGWRSVSSQELKASVDWSHHSYGFRLGLQANERMILSLDFDCCGEKDDDGNRLGCEQTKALLHKYMAGAATDGMFSSSTEGNWNVLVDYTDCVDIVELVTQLNTDKFVKFNLEIKLGDNQVIPPTATECKYTHQIGKPRKFINEMMPFYIMTQDDFVHTFIKELMSEEVCKKVSPKIAKPKMQQPIQVTDSEPETNTENLHKIEDLLMNYIGSRFDKDGITRRKLQNGEVFVWNYTLKIAGCLKSVGNFELFERWCRLGAKRAIKDPSTTWNSANQVETKELAIRFLECILRDTNKAKFRQWRLYNHNEDFSEVVISGDANGLGKFIKDDVPNLVYCREAWIEFNEYTHLWGLVKQPHSTISTYLQTQIGFEMETFQIKINDEKDEDKKRKIQHKYDLLKVTKIGYGNFNNCKNILTFLAKYLKNDSFIEKLDKNLYRQPFQNGMLCLKTMEFRHGIRYDDYITKTLDFNYQKADEGDKTIVRQELKKICNNKEEDLNYMLSLYGYSFTSDSQTEQFIWAMKGETASNGKSVVPSALSSIAPNFVKELGSEVFELAYKNKHKVVAMLGGYKFCWINELRKGQKQDEAFLKILADGTTTEFQVLFGTMGKLCVDFKLMFVGNHTIKLDADEGVARRYKHLQMNSSFKEEYLEDDYDRLRFKMDKNFGRKLATDYKHAFLEIIFEYSQKYWLEKKMCPYPAEWKGEADKIMAENNTFKTWFDDNFELGGTTENFDFEELMTESQKKEFKDDLKNLKNKFVYDRLKSGKQREMYVDGFMKKIQKKGVWTGFKLRNDEVVEPEMENED